MTDLDDFVASLAAEYELETIINSPLTDDEMEIIWALEDWDD